MVFVFDFDFRSKKNQDTLLVKFEKEMLTAQHDEQCIELRASKVDKAGFQPLPGPSCPNKSVKLSEPHGLHLCHGNYDPPSRYGTGIVNKHWQVVPVNMDLFHHHPPHTHTHTLCVLGRSGLPRG